jgi:hypothetical protein
MSPAQHLRLITEDGELAPDAPQTFGEALEEIENLRAERDRLEDDLRGYRLRLAKAETDREERALQLKENPEVELVHACWKRACKRRAPLHFTERELIAAAVRKLGLETCLRAIAGAAYDPMTKRRRNGSEERFDKIELIFRRFSNVADFADRAPAEWAPKPDKIAQIAGVPEDWVRERLEVKP